MQYLPDKTNLEEVQPFLSNTQAHPELLTVWYMVVSGVVYLIQVE